MDDNVINIKRRGASLNLFELESIISNTKTNSMKENTINIKLLNYQDLFDYIQIVAKFDGTHYKFNYNNGLNVTLQMRSIKSITDYLFRYWNDTNIYSKQDNHTNSNIKN